MVKELNGNIIAAVILIMVLVIASMGTRVSMLVGLSIPFCFLMTYLILYSLGMEVNFLVMMGLLLGMGMLIDGSIVITEYADKKIAEGLSRAEGYTLASKRMFYPIIASTGTTLAAFIPIIRIAILFGFTATLLIGGFLALDGEIKVATYSVMLFITQRLLWPLTELGISISKSLMSSLSNIISGSVKSNLSIFENLNLELFFKLPL